MILTASGEYFADVIEMVNKKRARRLLRPFIYDEKLTQESAEVSMQRASKDIKGHLRNNDWSHSRAEGVGHRSGIDWVGINFISCYLYTRKYKYAGATLAISIQEITYYTLRLK